MAYCRVGKSRFLVQVRPSHPRKSIGLAVSVAVKLAARLPWRFMSQGRLADDLLNAMKRSCRPPASTVFWTVGISGGSRSAVLTAVRLSPTPWRSTGPGAARTFRRAQIANLRVSGLARFGSSLWLRATGLSSAVVRIHTAGLGRTHSVSEDPFEILVVEGLRKVHGRASGHASRTECAVIRGHSVAASAA